MPEGVRNFVHVNTLYYCSLERQVCDVFFCQKSDTLDGVR